MLPALLDELLEEAFLLLPTDEPEHLVLASSVCKPWRRILADAGFRRRYRELHGAPPVLGFFHNGDLIRDTRLVPTSAASRRFRPLDLFALDCRHGRALFLPSHCKLKGALREALLVWDPVTGDQSRVPSPNMSHTLGVAASVLCAAQGCDHSGCQGGPFRVAIVTIGGSAKSNREICARLYSSETGTWSQETSLHHDKRGTVN